MPSDEDQPETDAELAPVEEGDGGDAASEGPDQREIVVQNNVKTRLDVYLHGRLKGISRSKVQKLIELGGVTVNAAVPKASTAVRSGDVIHVILPPMASRRILPENIPLSVVYEDDDLIVLNKQAGLIVHPARSNLSGTLINGLAYRFKQHVENAGGEYRDRQTRGFRPKGREKKQPIPKPEPVTATPGIPGIPGTPDLTPRGDVEGLSNVGAQEFRPGIIHRLDKNTTGCIVVAKNDETHWLVARQFENRTTLKAYLAIVHGNFDTVGGAVEAPIGKHPTIREAMAIRHDHASRHALTLYRVREQYEGYALVELELKTGRTHQIRVHMAYLGHPIVGDVLYGGEPVGRAELDKPPLPAARRDLVYAREKSVGERIEAQAKLRPDLFLAHPALHAALLQIRHPRTDKDIRFTAPLHAPMMTLVRELRKRKKKDAPVVTEGHWVDLKKATGEEESMMDDG